MPVSALTILHLLIAAVAVVTGIWSIVCQVRGQPNQRWTTAFLVAAAASAAASLLPPASIAFAVGIGGTTALVLGVMLRARLRREPSGGWQIVEIVGSATVVCLLTIEILARLPLPQPLLQDKDLWMSIGTGFLLMLLQLFFIDLLIKRHERQRVKSTWAAANREFLASCLLIGWSVTRATSYYLRRSEDKQLLPPEERRLLLRTGIENALLQVAYKSQTFDRALQLGASGFDDEARAKLATVGFWLRSAGAEAAAALKRYERLQSGLRPLSDVSPNELGDHQVRAYGVAIPNEMAKRDRALLVYHIGELADFSARAGRDLREFVLLRDTVDGLSSSDLYRSLQTKHGDISVASDVATIDSVTAHLTDMHDRIVKEGICLVLTEEIDDDVEAREWQPRPSAA